MLPTESSFSEHMGRLGITKNDTVVCYDSFGIFSSPRIWWMLKAFGHEKVAVLDGGLKKWVADKNPVESTIPTWSSTKYEGVTKRNESLVIDYPELVNNLLNFTADPNPICMIDARPAGRFSGADLEPRPNLASGHAPGSINIPFGLLLNSDGTMKSKEELIKVFQEKRIDLTNPIVTSCGSGVTAAIIFLALDIIGKKDVRLYDGSWAEYASYKTSPIQKH
jgi:thiosulfate/3-mercaptopyruvate sulfurtransferase